MENENKLKKQERRLPKIEELYADTELAIKESELQVLLNQKPLKKWIKEHPIAKKEIINQEGQKVKVPYEYIPIERLTWLMNRIFGGYQTEIKETKLIANSVQVTVRIYYKNILNGGLMYQDGVGAVPIQIDSKEGAGAIDFQHMRANAIQLGAPAAASFAEKDAFGRIGRLFGRDLNRNEESVYISSRESFNKVEFDKLRKQLSSLLMECKDQELKQSIIVEMSDAEESNNLTTEMLEIWINKLQ